MLNNWLREDQIGYSLLKYPQSEESEVSLGFEDLIVEVDNFGNNSNDLIYKSKVQFEFAEDSNYNSEIMRLLNYLIELPKKDNIGEAFHVDMEHFFKNIYSQEEVQRMKMFERAHPDKYKEKFGDDEIFRR